MAVDILRFYKINDGNAIRFRAHHRMTYPVRIWSSYCTIVVQSILMKARYRGISEFVSVFPTHVTRSIKAILSRGGGEWTTV